MSLPASRPDVRVGSGVPLSATELMLLSIGVVGVVLLMGRLDAWAAFLSSDVGTYIQRVSDFLDHHSLEGGEYQPGALFFFAAVKLLEHFALGFCDALEGVNCVLMALHLTLINRIAGRGPTCAAALLFLAAGPIAMYRFELLCSFVVLCAWLAWRSGRDALAGVLLGVAVTIKVYPIVLFPIFMLGSGRVKPALTVAAGGVGGLVGVLGAFAAVGGSIRELMATLAFHAHKPVALESVLGTLMQLAATQGWVHLHEVDEFGIHGFVLGDAWRMIPTIVTVVAIVAVWVLAWRRRPYTADVGTLYLASILASVIVISTLYVPQYLLWMMVFVCLSSLARVRPRAYWGMIGLLALLMVAQQYIYPCHYDDYLQAIEAHTAQPTFTLQFCLYGGKALLLLFYAGLQAQLWSRPEDTVVAATY